MDFQQGNKVEELLQKKIQLTETLLSYAKQLSGLSFSAQPVQYQNIVETRTNLIEDIKKVDIVVQHHLAAIGTAEASLIQQVKDTNERVAILIKQINSLDEKSKTLITEEMTTTKDKLQALHKGKKGVRGYNRTESEPNLAGAYTDSKR